jgi:hypothetical protein
MVYDIKNQFFIFNQMWKKVVHLIVFLSEVKKVCT